MGEHESSDAWSIAVYQESLADIRWAKERMGDIVRWAVVLQGALTAVARSFSAFSSGWLVTFGLLIAVCAVWWLVDLNLFARRTRNRVIALLETAPALALPKRSRDRHHVTYLVIQSLVIAIACTIAIGAILTAPATDSASAGSQPENLLQLPSGEHAIDELR